MKNLAVLCLLACFAVLCFAETRGSAYLQKQGNSLVLIGYISKTEQTVRGASVKAADGLP